MQSLTPEPQALRRLPPLRAVIDSCVLADQRWLTPIVLTAEAGYVAPLWSPCIIAETSRLHARLWMKRRGVPRTNADRRAFSEQAHHWFAYVSRVFRVVEDALPPSPS